MLIPKRVFAVSKIAASSCEGTRYTIHGVLAERLTDGKCAVAATDGRKLIQVTWNDEHLQPEFPAIGVGSVEAVKGFSQIISTSQWNEAEKTIPESRYKRILEHCLVDETSPNDRVYMSTTNLESQKHTNGSSIEGRFPNYKEVIPEYTVGENAVELGMDPVLLANLLRVLARVATDENSKGVRLVIPTDPRKPMLAEAELDGVQAKAVIMPLNLAPKLKRMSDGSIGHKGATQVAKALFTACETFVKAFNVEDKAERSMKLREAYSLALDALSATGWKLDDPEP